MRKWEKVEIGKHIDQIRGVSYGGDDAVDETKDGYLPILRSNNIGEGKLNLEDLVYVHNRFVKDVQKLREGDILITASTGSKQAIGKNGYVEKDYNGSFGAFCKVVRPKKSIDKSYLKHFFQSPKYRETIRHVINGANINNIKNEHIDKQKIPLPPLPIQQQIAEVLDTADALRRCTQEQLDALDELAQGVFLEMFGDPALNPKEFPVEALEKFYINPKEGTKCGPFGSALKKDEYTKAGIAVWVMDNITTKGEFIENDCLWITPKKYDQLKGYSVKNGDVIISRAGTVGKMCVVESSQEKSIISSNLIRLRFDERKLLPLYFVNLMTHFRNRIGRLKKGNEDTFTHMSTAVLDNLKFPYPPLELQTQFAAIITNIEAQKAVLRESLRESEALFGGLLQRVFG